MRPTTSFGVLAVFLFSLQPGVAQEPVSSSVPSWEELRARPYPEWFTESKLGIFIHWGVYSVVAYGGKESYSEWLLRGLETGDTIRTRFMEDHYGAGFTYADLAPLFKAELFDPNEWAELFRRAGARYVVLVTKHHDGYALWPSRYSPSWNSVDVGPGRDIVGELTAAVRNAGLRMGLYYSLAEWNNPLHRWYTDPPDSIAPYVEQHMIPQFKELVAAYRPVVLFADGEWLNTAEQWHARELIDWYYTTVGPDAVVNNRWGAGSDIGFLTPEYSAALEMRDRPWTEVRGLGRSFGLNRNEDLEAYMTPDELVHFFVSAVAAGGGMILNVGPKADGQIPLLQQERLLQLGQWLTVNGAAIYGSRPWSKTGEEREVTLERVDPTIDFDWVRNSPGPPIREDNFTVLWTGYVEPLYSEIYEFEAEADDDVRAWVDGQLVIDQWEDERPVEAIAGTVRLEAGRKYAIRVEYREQEVNASVRLFWSSPRQVREIVPKARLYTTRDLMQGDGLRAVYRSMQQYMAYTTNNGNLYAITFEWSGDELALPVPEPASGTRIALLGLETELPWRYSSDTAYVDLSGISYGDVPGQWAWILCLEGYTAAR
ncbi:MAG: alpha-L-fucosidase [Gemmatimonadota bacterium]|nr:MAG: alpha-L-fucosidase [Gemmatimonadota bacterium]